MIGQSCYCRVTFPMGILHDIALLHTISGYLHVVCGNISMCDMMLTQHRIDRWTAFPPGLAVAELMLSEYSLVNKVFRMAAFGMVQW